MTEVDVLDGGRAVAQTGELQPAGEAPGLALGPLAVDQDADPILEAEVCKRVGSVELLAQGAAEGVQAHVAEFLKRFLVGHQVQSSFAW
jgi:hypothetical protein